MKKSQIIILCKKIGKYDSFEVVFSSALSISISLLNLTKLSTALFCMTELDSVTPLSSTVSLAISTIEHLFIIH